MPLNNAYELIPHDISGSTAKNRFSYELAIGLERMMEYYHQKYNYVIVFDYVCDIEYHCEENDELTFYQIKTTKSLTPFTATSITTKKGKKHSIIGTLCKLLVPDCKETINVVLVGNIQFKDNKKLIDSTKPYCFQEMSQETKNIIINHLETEGIISKKEFDKVFYMYNPMNILNYDDTMIGKLTKFYTENIDPNIIKINVLYSTLKSIISDKASFEQDGLTYDEVIKNKGLSRDEFTHTLMLHKNNSSNIIEKCIEEYKKNNINDIAGTIKIKRALLEVIKNDNIEMSRTMVKIKENLEEEISVFSGNIDMFVKYYIEKYKNYFSEEINYYEKYALILFEYIKLLED